MKKIVLLLLTLFLGISMAEEKKVLVIYYSRADENYEVGNITKGNTEIIAEMIAKKTGGTQLQVEPAKAYPKSYNDCINVAKKSSRKMHAQKSNRSRSTRKISTKST